MPQHFESLYALYRACHLPPPAHPLLSVFSFDTPMTAFSEHLNDFTSDFYLIALKKFEAGLMLYGRSTYDHQQGTLSFTRPGQLVALKNVAFEDSGFVIAFHKDYILQEKVYDEVVGYGFFDYAINEALHVSEQEEHTLWQLYHCMEAEYYNNEDDCSKSILLSHLTTLLRYANRYYQRQFRHRQVASSRLLRQFHQQLDQQLEAGTAVLPTVGALAQVLGLSPRYLSDLLKAETGKTAIEHIQIKLIDKAKNLLLVSDWSIAETAYHLGFDYPNYFSRLFKKQTGLSPKAYRQQHLH